MQKLKELFTSGFIKSVECADAGYSTYALRYHIAMFSPVRSPGKGHLKYMERTNRGIRKLQLELEGFEIFLSANRINLGFSATTRNKIEQQKSTFNTGM